MLWLVIKGPDTADPNGCLMDTKGGPVRGLRSAC